MASSRSIDSNRRRRSDRGPAEGRGLAELPAESGEVLVLVVVALHVLEGFRVGDLPVLSRHAPHGACEAVDLLHRVVVGDGGHLGRVLDPLDRELLGEGALCSGVHDALGLVHEAAHDDGREAVSGFDACEESVLAIEDPSIGGDADRAAVEDPFLALHGALHLGVGRLDDVPVSGVVLEQLLRLGRGDGLDRDGDVHAVDDSGKVGHGLPFVGEFQSSWSRSAWQDSTT